MEVVQLRLPIIDIPTIPQRVIEPQRIFRDISGDEITPSIVGVRGFPLFVPNGLHQFGQVVNAVVGVAYGVGAGAALFHILHHPIGEVKGTEKLSP